MINIQLAFINIVVLIIFWMVYKIKSHLDDLNGHIKFTRHKSKDKHVFERKLLEKMDYNLDKIIDLIEDNSSNNSFVFDFEIDDSGNVKLVDKKL